MTFARAAIALCFALLLGVPFFFQPPAELGGSSRLRVIILTPHNEQIRHEFGRGFERWHQEKYGEPAQVIFNVPGGTTEIRKMLEAQFRAAFANNLPPGGDADLVFGGGTYEHNRLKAGVEVVLNGEKRWEPITRPVDFKPEWLAERYGENRIADGKLYDPDMHWFGTALSGFGIVFNRALIKELEAHPPGHWADLGHPRLKGWVALVNPGQSGSVLTAFTAILQTHGWEEGWQILRRASGNARYFSGSSLKPPIDVSQGSAAAGVCIDFFGRYQLQALREAGEPDRIGYVDPPGGSTIDADPISMLRNAPNAEVAERFIEFCLSDEGQALWQFSRRGEGAALGPDRFELRRMPVIRSMYERYGERFIDKVNPFELAASAKYPDQNYRDLIVPMFSAMAMDNHSELKRAWQAIIDHPEYPHGQALVTADEVSDRQLRQMLELFDALPAIAGPSGQLFSLSDTATLGAVRAGWLKNGWESAGLWNPQTTPADEMRRRFGEFFRKNYLQIIDLAAQRS